MSQWDDIATPEDLAELAKLGIHWDVRAMRLVSGIERSVVALDLDCQAQFVSLLNTLQVQLESGRPDRTVVRLLGEALLALAAFPPKSSTSPRSSPSSTSASRALPSSSHRLPPGNQIPSAFCSA